MVKAQTQSQPWIYSCLEPVCSILLLVWLNKSINVPLWFKTVSLSIAYREEVLMNISYTSCFLENTVLNFLSISSIFTHRMPAGYHRSLIHLWRVHGNSSAEHSSTNHREMSRRALVLPSAGEGGEPGQPQCLRHCEPDSIIPRLLSRVRPSEPRDCRPQAPLSTGFSR